MYIFVSFICLESFAPFIPLLGGRTFGSWFRRSSTRKGFGGSWDFACWCDKTQASGEHTRSGCGSKQQPAAGERGREREIGRSRSSLLSRCRTLRPLSVTVSLLWPRASGWRHSAAPSIHQSLPVSSYTHTHTSMFFSVSFAVSHFICLRQWGLLRHALFTTNIPASTLILVLAQRLWDVLFSNSSSVAILHLSEGQIPLALAKSGEKNLRRTAGTTASWMIDAWMLTHHTGERNQ